MKLLLLAAMILLSPKDQITVDWDDVPKYGCQHGILYVTNWGTRARLRCVSSYEF